MAIVKKEEIIKYDERNACPCKICKKRGKLRYPLLSDIDGLFYAKCPCCDKYSPYEFLGITPKCAIATWNNTMLHNDMNLDK